MSTQADHARTLRALHEAPEILVLANVWDVASARAVAAVEGIRALATASHGIAAVFGHEDGEEMSLDLHLSMVERIVADAAIPVSMDAEAGYGDAGETTRRLIAAGVAGANLEDRRRPLGEAVAAVEAVVAAREAEGTDFVLNARTDAFVLSDPDASLQQRLDEATARGRAFLEADADVVFVPRALGEEAVAPLVEVFGPRRLSVIAPPSQLPLRELERLGVARASVGPWGYRTALSAYQDAAAGLVAGGSLPAGVREDAMP